MSVEFGKWKQGTTYHAEFAHKGSGAWHHYSGHVPKEFGNPFRSAAKLQRAIDEHWDPDGTYTWRIIKTVTRSRSSVVAP